MAFPLFFFFPPSLSSALFLYLDNVCVHCMNNRVCMNECISKHVCACIFHWWSYTGRVPPSVAEQQKFTLL